MNPLEEQIENLQQASQGPTPIEEEFHGRVTVLQTVHYQPLIDDQSYTIESRYDYEVRSEEMVYDRRIKLTKWQPIDWGPFQEIPEQIGEVVIQNLLPHHSRNPTAEEKREDQSRVVFLFKNGNCVSLIRPGRSIRFEPQPKMFPELTNYFLEPEVTPTRIRVTIFPL